MKIQMTAPQWFLKYKKTPNKDHRSSQTVTRQTLIIGDSILKGINKSGLKTDVDVLTCPGKKLNEIQSNLSREIATKYNNIVVYAGGNAAARSTLYNDVKSLILDIRRKSESCAVYLCTACPRIDTDVLPLNELLKRTGEDMNARIIDCHQAFVFGNGNTARRYYHRDGIHLNAKGKRIKSQILPGWFSDEIRHAIKMRDWLKKNITKSTSTKIKGTM
ncbi:hypothetical protein DPMN_073409 [Dreissena polymorpha]|uniref:SGNH hydrolase-type esterase domain-containing protein n=1 Tax=Dreissena polymorpha TaxID=45954 RepID=A0A9D4BYZ4_DREPO|nr:hypothetical protein DPMN_073409 [Dreissena polymorpha]